VVSWVDTNVLEKHGVSIFRAEMTKQGNREHDAHRWALKKGQFFPLFTLSSPHLCNLLEAYLLVWTLFLKLLVSDFPRSFRLPSLKPWYEPSTSEFFHFIPEDGDSTFVQNIGIE
jgi:hypothetical protein